MISIIIPTLNEEKVIGSTLKALTSGLRTTSYEIIVSDGKSTDWTVEIAKEYTDKVIVHSGEGRQNISGGRNDGAQKAKGEFLVFLDADCELQEPDAFFDKALSRFKDDKKLAALTARIKVFPKDETLMDRIFFSYINLTCRLMNNYFHRGGSAGEFQMIRREAFEACGGFRRDLVAYEDFDMFSRLSKKGRTLYEPALVVYHTGRRAHRIGWPRLLFDWGMNTVYVLVFNRSYSKEWKVVR